MELHINRIVRPLRRMDQTNGMERRRVGVKPEKMIRPSSQGHPGLRKSLWFLRGWFIRVLFRLGFVEQGDGSLPLRLQA